MIFSLSLRNIIIFKSIILLLIRNKNTHKSYYAYIFVTIYFLFNIPHCSRGFKFISYFCNTKHIAMNVRFFVK